MLFPLKDLRKIRKKFGLTQHQFAKLAGVSQSLIAKVESRNLDPTYSKVQKMDEAVQLLNRKVGAKITSIMTKNILTAKPDDRLIDIAKLMRNRGISQVPVVKDKAVVGIVTEAKILDHLGEKISSLKVADATEDSPPVVSSDAPLEVVSSLLRHYPVVLVVDKGELAGIISKADLLKTFV